MRVLYDESFLVTSNEEEKENSKFTIGKNKISHDGKPKITFDCLASMVGHSLTQNIFEICNWCGCKNSTHVLKSRF